MIKINNISKYFGKSCVLESISTTIKKGEIIVIIGPSGSGKSTLLRCINSLESLAKGKILVDNIPISSDKFTRSKIKMKIGMVFQNFNLFPHMTVMENLIYAPIKIKKINKEKAIKLASSLLKKVGLYGKEKSYPSNLSGGEKQRVAIARCLAMEPEIILFDEPTSSLDPEMTNEVLAVIKNLTKTNITMVIVTHEIGFAKEIANRILFMDKGKLLEDRISNEFFLEPATDRAKEFLNKIL